MHLYHPNIWVFFYQYTCYFSCSISLEISDHLFNQVVTNIGICNQCDSLNQHVISWNDILQISMLPKNSSYDLKCSQSYAKILCCCVIIILIFRAHNTACHLELSNCIKKNNVTGIANNEKLLKTSQ